MKNEERFSVLTDTEKRILENQEVILAALARACGDNIGPDSTAMKMWACYDETRKMLGKQLPFDRNRYDESCI